MNHLFGTPKGSLLEAATTLLVGDKPEVYEFTEEAAPQPVPGKIYEVGHRFGGAYDALFLSGSALRGIWARVDPQKKDLIQIIELNMKTGESKTLTIFQKAFLKSFAKI